MANVVAVVSSDWHLDRGAFARLPELTGDGPFALDQIVTLCLERHASLFGCGDLLDTSAPDPESLRVIFRQYERLRRAGLELHFVQGDHDLHRDGPFLGILGDDGPVHLDWAYLGREVLVAGRRVVGVDFRRGEESVKDAFDEAYALRPDVVVCHQRWREFMGNVAKVDGALADLPPFAALWTGDLHCCLTRRVGVTTVLSPGATHQRAIDEPDEHFVWLLLDDDGAAQFKLRSRRSFRALLQTEAELEEWLTVVRPAWCEYQVGVPGDIARSLVEVRFKADLPKAAARVRQAVGDTAHLKLEPLPTDELAAAAAELIGPPGADASREDLARLVRHEVPAEDVEDVLQLMLLDETGQKQFLAEARRRALGEAV